MIFANPSRLFWLFLLVLVGFGISNIAFPSKQEEQPEAVSLEVWFPAEPKATSKENPGLLVKARSLKDGNYADFFSTRMAALAVPKGETISPFIPAGRFEAFFAGTLTIRLWREVDMWFEGRGEVVLSVNDQVILQCSGTDLAKKKTRVKLKTRANKIAIAYRSPAKGGAELRLMWNSDQHPPGPVPPNVFSHPPAIPDYLSAISKRRGRNLIASLRCTSCHKTPLADPSEMMPELAMDAPNLQQAGARLQRNWLAHWLQNPKKLKPTASMPQVLHSTSVDDTEKASWDLAAFLASLGKPQNSKEDLTNKITISTGGHLFASLGCAACHLPADSDQAEQDDSVVPLHLVGNKYHPKSLISFLQDPDQHYQWIRMPDFRLGEKEAVALAAFLLSKGKKELPGPGQYQPDIGKGKLLYGELGCANCHQPKDGQPLVKPAHEMPTLPSLKTKLKLGCIASDKSQRGKAPDYHLNKADQLALEMFLKSDPISLARHNAREFSQRRIEVLRCNACHPYDQDKDRFSQISDACENLLFDLEGIEDEKLVRAAEESAKQTRPDLTWAGDKMLPEWMGPFIAGKRTLKPRYWVHARMPSFPLKSQLLANGIAQQHGFLPRKANPEKVDPLKAKVGKELISKKAFNCISCHIMGDKKPTAVFEAPGVNLALTSTRLRKSFYTRWMLKPDAIEPETRMPAFALPNGKTLYRDAYDGDAILQAEAIWQRLREVQESAKQPEQP